MEGRYFKFKLVVGILYVLSIAATSVWVVQGWPEDEDNDLGAEIHAVPGALGRTLILLANTGEKDWSNVIVTLNDNFVYQFPNVPPGAEERIPLESFSYAFAIPRNWNRGTWENLSPDVQPTASGYADLEPQNIVVTADQGIANATLTP